MISSRCEKNHLAKALKSCLHSYLLEFLEQAKKIKKPEDALQIELQYLDEELDVLKARHRGIERKFLKLLREFCFRLRYEGDYPPATYKELEAKAQKEIKQAIQAILKIKGATRRQRQIIRGVF